MTGRGNKQQINKNDYLIK